MHNWKIGTRIAAGFGVVTLIAAALGLFAYSQVRLISKHSVDIAENSLPSVSLMGEVKANMQEVNGLIFQHITSTNAQEMAALDEKILAHKKTNSALLARYEKDLVANEKDRSCWAISTMRVALIGRFVRRSSRSAELELTKRTKSPRNGSFATRASSRKVPCCHRC